MDYLEIIVAGSVAFVMGAIWYNPKLFGKVWQSELGFKDEELEGANMALIFGTSFLLMVAMMFGLYWIVNAHPAEELTFSHGLFHGFMVGLYFAAASIGINYLYQRRSLKLFFIDAGYQVLFLAIGGGIMAVM